jgi:hypothetical protein
MWSGASSRQDRRGPPSAAGLLVASSSAWGRPRRIAITSTSATIGAVNTNSFNTNSINLAAGASAARWKRGGAGLTMAQRKELRR